MMRNNSSYISGNNSVGFSSGNFAKIVSSFFAGAILVIFASFALLSGGSKASSVKADGGFNLEQQVACLWGSDSIPALMYKFQSTSYFQFLSQSKSSINFGSSAVDGGLNALIQDPTKYKKINEAIIGHPLENAQTSLTENQKADKVAQLNPYDRFGLSGLNFTSYNGEWKYIDVDPCASSDNYNDPKTGLYYTNRLVPQSTWEDVDTSKDIRTQQFEKGWGNIGRSLNTLFANWLFDITKIIVALTIGFIRLSFSDISNITGLTKIIGGDGKTSYGIFGALSNGLLKPLALVAFAATGIHIFMVYRKGRTRESFTNLARTLILFFTAIVITLNPLWFIKLPNNVAVVLESIIVSGLNSNATTTGNTGLCATDAGVTKSNLVSAKTINAAKDSIDDDTSQNVLNEAVDHMESTIGCTFWQEFLLKPWSQGQFGMDWNQTWANGKMPDWAKKEGGAEFNNTPGNASMVGMADIPLGGTRIYNNWALFNISVNTNAHSGLGDQKKTTKYTNDEANDWWRIVDVLSNYEETVVKNPDATGAAGDSPNDNSTDTTTSTTDNSSSSPSASSSPSGTSTTAPAGTAGSSRGYPIKSRTMSPNYNHHSGIDYPTPVGTPIYATADATVDYVGTGRGYGIGVFLDFPNGEKAVFGHTSKPVVKAGDHVKLGQEIALSGNTGHSTGPHVHYEVVPVGGKFDVPSNRDYTLKWLQGASSPSGTVTGDNTDSNTTPAQDQMKEVSEYSVPKDNPPLPAWNTWVGGNSGDRYLSVLSSILVAGIGLFSPLAFSFMGAIYAFTITIAMALAPVAFLLGCWSGRGWEIFKSWAEYIGKYTIRRVVTGALMVVSIIFTTTCIDIMDKQNWFEGVILLSFASIILFRSRHKVLDMATSFRMTQGHFHEATRGAGMRQIGYIKSTNKLVSGGLIAGVAARRRGGSFTEGAKAGLKPEVFHLAHQSQTIRQASATYRENKNYQERIVKGNENYGPDSCKCGASLRNVSTIYYDKYGNAWCPDCYNLGDAGNRADLIEVNNVTDAQARFAKVQHITMRTAFQRKNFDSIIANSAKTGLAKEKDLEDFVADATGRDIANYIHSKDNFRHVQRMPKPPTEIQQYLDQDTLDSITENSSTATFETLSEVYSRAWALYFVQNYGNHADKDVEEFYDDVKESLFRTMQQKYGERMSFLDKAMNTPDHDKYRPDQLDDEGQPYEDEKPYDEQDSDDEETNDDDDTPD